MNFEPQASPTINDPLNGKAEVGDALSQPRLA